MVTRPSPELLERLREDKRRLHAEARALSPAEKVQRVAALREESSVDPLRLDAILRRYNLEVPW